MADVLHDLLQRCEVGSRCRLPSQRSGGVLAPGGGGNFSRGRSGPGRRASRQSGLMSRFTWMRDKRRSRLSTRRAARMFFAVCNPQLFDIGDNDAVGRRPRERVTASPARDAPSRRNNGRVMGSVGEARSRRERSEKQA